MGAIQGIFFAAYLSFKPLRNRRASFFLALFIFSFAANSIYYLLETFGLRKGLGFWDFSILYCPLLVITSFYFFVRFLVDSRTKLQVWEKLIWIPCGFQVFWQVTGSILTLTSFPSIIRSQRTIFQVYGIFDLLLIGLSVLILGFVIYRIKNFDHQLERNFSDISSYSLIWLNRLIFMLIGILLFFAIPGIYENATGNTSYEMYYPMWIFSSILIYWIAYTTYARRQGLTPDLIEQSATPQVNKLSEKTKKYHSQLQELMLEERLYLDPDLSLKKLARQLDISGGYLSQVINQYESKNFFEFINTFRVDEVKRKMASSDFDHLNLLGIAYDSGFKSKSTFNLAFKKISGKTPSQFKKALATN